MIWKSGHRDRCTGRSDCLSIVCVAPGEESSCSMDGFQIQNGLSLLRTASCERGANHRFHTPELIRYDLSKRCICAAFHQILGG